jgi:flagellar M-ring protein FliF
MAFVDSNALKNRATGILSNFSMGQKAVIGVAVLALLLGGFTFTKWASKPAMAPLFTNLESSDAASITDKLNSAKVKYELADSGHTIMVPQSKVYDLRLQMSAAGLPTGSNQGYSLLDKNGITTSEFMQHVDYQRALEGELSKTIGSISGVNAATVHLVIPQQDVFANDSRKPSASVLVKTAPGKSLSNQQVQSVVNLVASSVEGLDPTNVTVSDDKGRLLASPGGSSSSSDSDSQASAASSLEDQLRSKVQAILTPLVGDGHSVVQARAELNWDKSSSISDIYNPNNRQQTVSSEHTTTETMTGGTGTGTSTGVLGPNGTGGTTTGAGQNYASTDSTKDYSNDHTRTTTEQAQGQPERISLSVLIDSSVPNIDTAQVEQLVRSATGINDARGDSVTVSRMAFDTSTADANAKELVAAEKAKKQEQLFGMIKVGATFLVILVVLIVLFFVTKKRADNYTATPISMAELDAARPSYNADDMLDGLELAAASRPIDDSPEALERAKVDAEITDLIEKQPDEVASLLRSWLGDRRS